MSLRIATWNMHAGVGIDGRFSPARVARVLAGIDADVIALQEFGSRRGFDMLAHVECAARARGIAMPTFSKHGCDFGNVVLSRLEVRSSACVDLASGAREPRNAVDLVIDLGGHDLRVIATHLGLSAAERRGQLARLAAILQPSHARPTVLLGDFNDWRRTIPAQLAGLFVQGATPATFPSPYPVAALDRIWVAPAEACISLQVHRSRTARITSDHLPLVAILQWPIP